MIPYGRPMLDDGGYFVRCPGCAKKFYGTGRTEDEVTKSANRLYAEHYAAKHEGGHRMTVGELIEVLQGYNSSLPIFVDDWDEFVVSTGEDNDAGECLVIEQP